jgi:hypothetical protein
MDAPPAVGEISYHLRSDQAVRTRHQEPLAITLKLCPPVCPDIVSLWGGESSNPGCSSLAKADELPFEELKLDRSYVADCGTDRVNAPLANP